MNICKLFSKITESRTSALFNHIIGYNDVKRLIRMALDSDEQSHILLPGPPCISQNNQSKETYMDIWNSESAILLRPYICLDIFGY